MHTLLGNSGGMLRDLALLASMNKHPTPPQGAMTAYYGEGQTALQRPASPGPVNRSRPSAPSLPNDDPPVEGTLGDIRESTLDELRDESGKQGRNPSFARHCAMLPGIDSKGDGRSQTHDRGFCRPLPVGPWGVPDMRDHLRPASSLNLLLPLDCLCHVRLGRVDVFRRLCPGMPQYRLHLVDQRTKVDGALRVPVPEGVGRDELIPVGT